MTTKTADQLFVERFAAKEHEARDIAYSLGRSDIFERDLRGEARIGQGTVSRREAIEDALSGLDWYLEEEHEHIEDEYARDAAHGNDPRVAKMAAIRRYLKEGK